MSGTLLYEGKGKQLYSSDDPSVLIQRFKDDATAFDGKKHEVFADKGRLNCAISTFIFEKMDEAGIPTHLIETISPLEMRVRHLDMFPVEVVIRNIAAGSICKRLGLEEGITLPGPLTEFFYKSDELGDPMITEDHCELFDWADRESLKEMRHWALEVNRVMSGFFDDVGIRLVDFKLEFGKADGKMYLGDEITPDSCRLWDKKTGEKLDKDVFRQDLGGLTEVYHTVADRLGITIEAEKQPL